MLTVSFFIVHVFVSVCPRTIFYVISYFGVCLLVCFSFMDKSDCHQVSAIMTTNHSLMANERKCNGINDG